MRAARWVVCGVALIASLAGCSAPGFHWRSPVDGAHSIPLDAQQIRTQPEPPEGSAPVAWSAERIASDRVYLSASSTACVVPSSVTLTSSTRAVVIGVYGERPGKGTICAADLVTLFGYVVVPGGLHGRRLLHAR